MFFATLCHAVFVIEGPRPLPCWSDETRQLWKKPRAERHGPLNQRKAITPACAIEHFYCFAAFPFKYLVSLIVYPNSRHISLVYVGWGIWRGRRRGGKISLQCIMIRINVNTSVTISRKPHDYNNSDKHLNMDFSSILARDYRPTTSLPNTR